VTTLKLGKKTVGNVHPTYFVADISANHDGDLERAKLLIRLCAEAGADAAKFQNLRASKIVSDRGFRSLGYSCRISPVGRKVFTNRFGTQVCLGCGLLR
jgi:sialic acid synthase SpsE